MITCFMGSINQSYGIHIFECIIHVKSVYIYSANDYQSHQKMTVPWGQNLQESYPPHVVKVATQQKKGKYL